MRLTMLVETGTWIIVVILAVRPSDSEFNNSSNGENAEYFGPRGTFARIRPSGSRILFMDRLEHSAPCCDVS